LVIELEFFTIIFVFNFFQIVHWFKIKLEFNL